MLAASLSNSIIVAAYRQKTASSAALAREARELFPGGVTHDGRYLEPYGIYVARAQGSHKWDVDGNQYIDYYGGHGALLLGHNHPDVLTAVRAAVERGTHFGANHAPEIRWGKLVRQLIPSAERVRFTSSGTEATHLALRLARARTGRRKILRFKTHFHGWHDHMTSGYTSHFDGTPVPGVLPEVAERVVLLAPMDAERVRALLSEDRDIAAAILEPTGGTFGRTPITAQFLRALREFTAEHGVALIFDEVITGFRVSPGGAQGHYGITPDLTTLAKILAGGLPGGAVAGRRDLLDLIDHDAARNAGFEKIQHQGTYNANPVCAAAGVAALECIASGEACRRANALGAALRGKLNEALEAVGVPWAVHGEFSGFHIFTNPNRRKITPSSFIALEHDYLELRTTAPLLANKFRLAMLTNGVDLAGWPGGFVSAAHTEDDVRNTVEAFREALIMLRRDGEL